MSVLPEGAKDCDRVGGSVIVTSRAAYQGDTHNSLIHNEFLLASLMATDFFFPTVSSGPESKAALRRPVSEWFGIITHRSALLDAIGGTSHVNTAQAANRIALASPGRSGLCAHESGKFR